MLGFFRDERLLAVTAALLLVAFLGGVVCASLGRRHVWLTRPHGATVLTTLSYVTGTLVKIGQGIERHINGGEAADWLGCLLLYASFVVGAAAGGCISLAVSGSMMLVAATVVSALTTGYTYFYVGRHGVFR